MRRKFVKLQMFAYGIKHTTLLRIILDQLIVAKIYIVCFALFQLVTLIHTRLNQELSFRKTVTLNISLMEKISIQLEKVSKMPIQHVFQMYLMRLFELC